MTSNTDWRHSDQRYDNEVWSLLYDGRPYLEQISDPDLDQRYREIVQNVEYMVCDLRDGVPVEGRWISSWWWLKTRFETEREYRRRGRSLPCCVRQSLPTGPVPHVPSYPEAAEFIVRYGEARWLEPMLKKGVLRLRAASEYKGEVDQRDLARHDDELKSHQYISGNRVRITNRSAQTIPVIGNLKQTTTFTVDYFVLCCSHEFDYRLFAAFKNNRDEPADDCLVIRNVDEFARRLEVAGQKKLPGWEFYHNPVMYFDPHNPAPDETISPGSHKDFKYAYQREYRFLWFPVSESSKVESKSVHLEIGSLEDIAALHYFNGRS